MLSRRNVKKECILTFCWNSLYLSLIKNYLFLAKNNQLKIGRWQSKNFDLIVFDMSHVNEALSQYKSKPVHGIIGADVLLIGKAIIDYYNHYLYYLWFL